MKKLGVAILGLGVVGGGTYKILTDNKEYFKKTQKLDITVESVLERNKQRAVDLGIEEEKIASSIEEVISNPAVDVVVEVIGGIEPARTFVLKALMSGKTVVTSNKELVCKHWYELEAEAKKMNAGLLFEASCVGAFPLSERSPKARRQTAYFRSSALSTAPQTISLRRWSRRAAITKPRSKRRST